MELYESREDYLETILILKEKLGAVRSIDIAREMKYSKPSVSVAMKKLKVNGYIVVNDDGTIDLTPLGLELASKTYEKHLLLVNAFIKLGVSEEIAREDACKIEHHLSEETFDALKKFVEKI
jgi:Mn-dependent DtxR family transcriptional regulator